MANPIIKRVDMAVGGRAMTVEGTVKKTAFLLAISATFGIGFFVFALMSGLGGGAIKGLFVVALISAIVLGFVIASKPHLAKKLAVPFALVEGLFIGLATLIGMSYAPSVPATALCATFVTAALMLGLYHTGVIKVTQKFRSIVTSALMAIGILYMVQIVLSLGFGSNIPFLFGGGAIAIGFCLFVIVFASFSLLIDFDNIENGVAMGISEDYEWVFSVGLLSTLVWMYWEFIRLLGLIGGD